MICIFLSFYSVHFYEFMNLWLMVSRRFHFRLSPFRSFPKEYPGWKDEVIKITYEIIKIG